MSIISSKQSKEDNLVDSLFVFLILILILLVLTPSNGNRYGSVRAAPGTLDRMGAGVLTSAEVSFSADQQYWNANCSHGWSSDAGCKMIVLRTQSCSISIESVYCSRYETYLQEYLNK